MTIEVGKITKVIFEKEGIKMLDFYWSLDRYDTLVMMEAPDEKAAMKANLKY